MAVGSWWREYGLRYSWQRYTGSLCLAGVFARSKQEEGFWVGRGCLGNVGEALCRDSLNGLASPRWYIICSSFGLLIIPPKPGNYPSRINRVWSLCYMRKVTNIHKKNHVPSEWKFKTCHLAKYYTTKT